MPVRGHRCTFMAVCVTFLIPLSYLLSPLANSFFFPPLCASAAAPANVKVAL